MIKKKQVWFLSFLIYYIFNYLTSGVLKVALWQCFVSARAPKSSEVISTWRSPSSLKRLSLPICQSQPHPPFTTTTFFMTFKSHSRRCVNTHNTFGNDPFTMATTNKEKNPLARHKTSEEDGYWERERERVGRKSRMPSVLAAPHPTWQRALAIRVKNKPAVGCCCLLVVILHIPSTRTLLSAHLKTHLELNPCLFRSRGVSVIGWLINLRS